MKYIKTIYQNIINFVLLESSNQDVQSKAIASLLAKQTRIVSSEFLNWALSKKHCWDWNDQFCVGENKNKWHDDNGTFITHEQLFLEYLKYLEEERKFNLVV